MEVCDNILTALVLMKWQLC